MVKNPAPAVQEAWIWSLGWADPLEEGRATHSSILACGIPWTEEPGGLQSMGSQRVGHYWATFTFTFLRYLGVFFSYGISKKLDSLVKPNDQWPTSNFFLLLLPGDENCKSSSVLLKPWGINWGPWGECRFLGPAQRFRLDSSEVMPRNVKF